MSQGMFLAKALFDNLAETPDELAFRRGDVLTVVEQNTQGLEGWWLCSLRGKHGIAPGNRLKILSGMVGEGVGGTLTADNANKSGMELYDQPKSGLQDYDVPPPNRKSLDVGPPSRRASNDSGRSFPGSRKASLGDDLYDTPPSSKRGSAENAGGIYDTPPSSKRASSERTPPHSNRSSASRDSGSNLLSSKTPSQLSLNQQNSSSSLNLPTVVKRRSGSHSSENCYETPPGSNRSSLERILSEEGPPIYESLSSATSTERLDTDEPTYDTPPSRSHALSQANHASQSSLRSVGSSESLLSNTSGVSSARLSQTTSLPDSARSSMDLPSDVYDVPPAAQEAEKSRKQLSMDSGLGFYDSPIKSRPSSSTSNTLTPSSEGMRTSQSSFDCKPSPSTRDIKRSKSLEHALDDLYDTPRNNAPKISMKKLGVAGSGSSTALNDPSGVYDIPPQVTRDSVISMRSDSSEENQRLSSSSLDSEQRLSDIPVWDELLLDLDSALELLVKRQQDVSKATSRLTGFVNDAWRTKASLQKTLYDIKVSCTLVRNSLHEFVDFAHGAIANAVRLPDRHLASRLQKYVSPLQSTLELVNKSFARLEEMKWQVSLLVDPVDKNKPDDLGQIALVAKDLLPEVKKVASFIQSNGSVLFKKANSDDGKRPVSSKPPIGPKVGDNNGGKGPISTPGKAKNIQHRPLPAVPGNDKGSLSPSTPMGAPPALADKSKVSIYDIKAALHKDDYVECDDLPPEKDPDQARKDVLEHCVLEYDYVQLDTRDSRAKGRSKHSEPVGSQKDYVETSDKSSKPAANKAELGGPEEKNSDMDMIPVKESTSGVASQSSDKLNQINDKDVASSNKTEQESVNSIDDTDLSEQDLKTPVNTNDSSTEESSFIIPSPESAVSAQLTETLDPNDRQVLVYYTEQMNTHSTLLGNAIDAFIGVVRSNQPPNVFISHSKFVIVSAHKLVHIGDSIHRNFISNNVSLRIMHCANHLCDCLKASVTATKTAALQYPSVPAVQEMVDRVIAVSHAAHELKLVITQAAK